MPPAVRTPCVVANTSVMNSATASTISTSPVTLTGKIADIYRTSSKAIAPTTPGRIAPGLLNSPMMP